MAMNPAIFQAATAAGTGIMGSILSYSSNRKQREANRDMAEYAYAKDLEMWERQNAYNSPIAQMQRLREAGLNPNLVYGQGAGSAGSAAQMPKYNAPVLPYKPVDISWIADTLGRYQEFQMRQAQIDNIKASTDNTNADALNKQVTNFLLKTQGKLKEQEFSQKEIVNPYQADVMRNKAKGSEAQMQQEFARLMTMSLEQQQTYLDNLTKEKRLTTIDLENENKKAQLLFNTYKNEWMKAGVTTSDNPALRIMVRMANALGLSDALGYLFK